MTDFRSVPKFEKKNHHYVPRFWQRHFYGLNGGLFKTQAGGYVTASVASTMTSDWTYTSFDEYWRPMDTVEDNLSEYENDAALLYQRILPLGVVVTNDDWVSLCAWLGVSATRHPNVMAKSNQLGADFLRSLKAENDQFLSYEHLNDYFEANLGSSLRRDEYEKIIEIGSHGLEAVARYIEKMLPYAPELPQTDALLAKDLISQSIQEMDLVLIDAPTGYEFILGDNPLPNDKLGVGFTVPLSKAVALMACICQDSDNPQRDRRGGTAAEVEKINLEQIGRSKVAISSSKDILKVYVEKYDAN
ncbi:DUF4238 domain-containing protein [Ochrobactrum sp. SFR4]|uniref:DUF4238 domain-containing protein n=1 Tax=Ochrobactrum sp. SFR4 TaxID=2717368 RepID=UPI001C8C2897|nr:DUF4238 domain-containing protein [Ochrobactrum sp. SFR4]